MSTQEAVDLPPMSQGQDMDLATRKALASRVRQERRARKMTQAELAAAADVSLGKVSNLERGRTIPQPANLRAILRVLNIEVPNDQSPVEVEQVGELDICPTCGRVKWPAEYEILFDVLGAYFNRLPVERRQAVFGEIARDVIERRLGEPT